MFNNVLKNPTLTGFKLIRVHTDKANNQRHVEYPDHWECVAWPKNPDDPDEVPASYHRDAGFGLAAGYMLWEAGYVQRGVVLRKGQRYLAKAVFVVNMAFHQGGYPPDWKAHIEWRFLFNDRGYQVESAWSGPSQPQYGVQEEALFVVEPVADIVIDFGLIFRSGRYPSTSGEILVRSIELLEVPSDYGAPTHIGNPQAAANSAPTAVSAPKVVTEEQLTQDSTPTVEVEALVSGRGVDLSDVMTDEDINVIAAGFRAAVKTGQFPDPVAAGFLRFAVVLEKLKNQRQE